jgi:hypothetical protein
MLSVCHLKIDSGTFIKSLNLKINGRQSLNLIIMYNEKQFNKQTYQILIIMYNEKTFNKCTYQI